MWGITGRGTRIGERRRSIRSVQAGLARIAVRGPLEHAVLELSGELDFSDVEDVRAFVADVPHRIVSIDLAGLDFVDGAGARLIDAIRVDRAELHGERPALLGVAPSIERTLRLVRSRVLSLSS
jgi:anti-anti-sigma factor